MKKRFLILLTALLAALLITVLVPRKGRADLGDFSGGSDYGGGDYGGSDYGGWDSGGYDYGSYDSGSSGRSSSSCTTGDAIGLSVCFFFLIGPIWTFIFIFMFSSNKNKKNSVIQKATPLGASRTLLSKLTPIEQYRSLDPSFSPEALQEYLKSLYVRMQECCTKRDVTPIRADFADALWQQFDRQVKQLKQMRRTNYVENISVLYVDLNGYYQDKGEDVIIAEIQTRITDYVAEDDTGSVVSGSKTREKIMTYEYALSRPIELRSAHGEGTAARICPNCGAALSANEAVKCPYCGSLVTFGDHDWTVYSIKGISQRTL